MVSHAFILIQIQFEKKKSSGKIYLTFSEVLLRLDSIPACIREEGEVHSYMAAIFSFKFKYLFKSGETQNVINPFNLKDII